MRITAETIGVMTEKAKEFFASHTVEFDGEDYEVGSESFYNEEKYIHVGILIDGKVYEGLYGADDVMTIYWSELSSKISSLTKDDFDLSKEVSNIIHSYVKSKTIQEAMKKVFKD